MYDMLGNVSEWCEDRYGDDSGRFEEDPPGPGKGSDRVFRGGSWSFNARNVRFNFLGFRCVRVPPAASQPSK